MDFLLTAKRDRKASLRFLRKAIGHHGVPEKIAIDKSGANTAAIESYNAEHETDIEIRKVKYLNNIVEQDHRAVKRVARSMLGFKSFRWGAATLAVYRTHAHDPQGPVARDRYFASSAAVLCAGRVNQFIVRGLSRPQRKFATEPTWP